MNERRGASLIERMKENQRENNRPNSKPKQKLASSHQTYAIWMAHLWLISCGGQTIANTFDEGYPVFRPSRRIHTSTAECGSAGLIPVVVSLAMSNAVI